MGMMTVGVAELKAKLSRYLTLAAAGEDVVVTDRGKPVARVTGLEPSAERQRGDLLDLEQAGLIRAPLRELPPDFWVRSRPDDPASAVRSAVVEERHEGR